MNHFLSAEAMSEQEIISLMQMASKFKDHPYVITKQLFAANMFFEPSTRTKMSFTVAEKKLGIETLDFSVEHSSVQKGESLYDTVKTLEAIGANMLVIRHSDDNWAKELESNAAIPIINAGAGKTEHPTQSLLDAYTIYQEFGTCKGVKVVICGDVKHSRVARSNANILTKLGAKVFFTSPAEYHDPTLPFPAIAMDEAVEIADVMMMLRIQHERHEVNGMNQAVYHQQFGLTMEREGNMKPHAIILHPAPVNRGVEIDSRLVECERSRIFKQMNNGVFIRMAVITTQLLQWGLINENQIIQREPTEGKQARTMRCAN